MLSSKEAESSEDEDIVGPMPAKGPVNYSVTAEFEKRAQRMKEKLTKGDDVSSQSFSLQIYLMCLDVLLMCMYPYAPSACLVSEEVRRRSQIPWTWRLQMVVSNHVGAGN